MSNEIAVREPPKVIAEITSRAGEIAAVLPKSIPSDRYLATFKTACMKEPRILKCTPRSVVEAVMKAAADGLVLDGREAAIQVRKCKMGKDSSGKDVWGEVAVYVPMFQGLQKRVRNSGEISAFLGASIVYEAEIARDAEGKPVNPSPLTGGLRFVYERGDNERIFHDPILFEHPGKPVAVYSIVRMRDGTLSRELMTRAQVEAIKMRGARDGKPANPVWISDEEEMWKKTVIRRHCKKLPMDGDLARVFENLDMAEGQIIDAEPQEPQDGDQPAAPARPRKKAGAGAQRVREAAQQTPEPEREPEPDTEDHDPLTGEIVDDRDMPDQIDGPSYF